MSIFQIYFDYSIVSVWFEYKIISNVKDLKSWSPAGSGNYKCYLLWNRDHSKVC